MLNFLAYKRIKNEFIKTKKSDKTKGIIQK